MLISSRLIVCGVMLSLTACLFAEEPVRYTIQRTAAPLKIDGKLDEPAWFAARSVGDFQFAWYESGKREQTVAKLLWDDQHLYVGYICEDAHISGTTTKRDGPVWKDDCVEVFVAPNSDHPLVYFNIEMNVRGMSLDNYHPEGVGSRPEQPWNPDGLKIATTVHGTLNDDSDVDSFWILEAAIPLADLSHAAKRIPPRAGDVWHLNLNRLGGKTNPQYSQWSPGTAKKPQFHRPQDFGRVIFSKEALPFSR